MIDTHTHLYFPEYGDEIVGIINRAIENGVSHFVLPNVDLKSVAQIKDFHSRYPNVTTMAIGLHPTEVGDDWENVVEYIEQEVSKDNYKAIGEIGMDLYWDQSHLIDQKKAFERQLSLAEKKNLPAIIHCRNAFEETLEIIEKIKPSVPLIFHSYTADKKTVRMIRKVCDPYFGINGVVTYKNAPELREALSEIGIEKIVLETDAPFLTPVPHRGKRNDSSFLPHIRDKIADTLQISPKQVEEISDKNAKEIFLL